MISETCQKKTVKQIAQKEESKLDLKLRVLRMARRISIVVGSFCTIISPLTLLIPLKRELKNQLSIKGLGKLNILCNNPIASKYCLPEEGLSDLAKKGA